MSRDEREPHSTEDDHAEGDEFGLVEGVGQLAAKVGEEQAEGRQQADVAQHQVEPSRPQLPALHHDLVTRQKNVSNPGFTMIRSFRNRLARLSEHANIFQAMQIKNVFSLQLCFIL